SGANSAPGPFSGVPDPIGPSRRGLLLVSLGDDRPSERVDHVVGSAALEPRIFEVVINMPAIRLESQADTVIRQVPIDLKGIGVRELLHLIGSERWKGSFRSLSCFGH